MLCMAKAQRLGGLSAPPTAKIAHKSQLAKEEGSFFFVFLSPVTVVTLWQNKQWDNQLFFWDALHQRWVEKCGDKGAIMGMPV